ncbi:MAG: MFS transporter [Chloroflexota bacterium]|nr:MFS transporter [Chloroflexota bacterium]MDQ6908533.1 MFS transporter [Chloroflexota bacterium]
MIGKSTQPAGTIRGAAVGAAVVSPARQSTFASLRIRDYRLLWWGMIVSNIGTWMQMVAQGYLVYQMTHSPFALGLVGFVRAVPVFTFSLFAGVVADRVDRRKLLIVTQSLAGVFALILGILTSMGVITVWMIMILAFMSASVAAFDNPTRQALVPDIVGKEYIANAVALQSAAFNGTGILGPSLAGLLLGFIGIAACFYINAISFLAVIVALFLMSSVPNRTMRKQTMLENLREGFAYVRGNRTVAALLILIGLVGLLGRPYTQLMPAVQRDVLHVGATGLGVLLAFSSIGALIGALAIASLSNFTHRGLLLTISIGAFGAALIGFATSRSFPLSLGLLVIVGGTATMSMSTTNMMIQLNVPAEFRGRIMSMYTMIAMGMMPLGSMVLGTIANFIGVPETLMFGGIGCLGSLVLVSTWVPAVRTAS